MHSGLHTSVGRRRGGIGRESVFRNGSRLLCLPGYGSWTGSMRTSGVARLQKKQAVSAKQKADIIT